MTDIEYKPDVPLVRLDDPEENCVTVKCLDAGVEFYFVHNERARFRDYRLSTGFRYNLNFGECDDYRIWPGDTICLRFKDHLINGSVSVDELAGELYDVLLEAQLVMEATQ